MALFLQLLMENQDIGHTSVSRDDAVLRPPDVTPNFLNPRVKSPYAVHVFFFGYFLAFPAQFFMNAADDQATA